MQRFDLLRRSLLDMNPDELRERIRTIRRERRITRDKPATKVAKVVKAKKAKTQLEKLLEAMTPSQREAVLKELGE